MPTESAVIHDVLTSELNEDLSTRPALETVVPYSNNGVISEAARLEEGLPYLQVEAEKSSVERNLEVIGERNQIKEEEEVVEEEVNDQLLLSRAMTGVKILPQPSTLVAELHPHQIQGISWLVHMFQNGMPMILGDQMGLGKTIQSIGFLAHLQQTLGKSGPHLIVVPLSVLSNWLVEIDRFCPSFRAVRFHGPREERNRIKLEEINDLKQFDIVVTTFEILVSEVNFFKRRYVWTSVIVDEGHRLKNDRSQLSEKLRSIPCLSKIILSGTPLQNNLKELWAMLFYLAPDIFTSSKPFEDGFDLAKVHIDSNVLRRARKLLGVFMLRRVKDQIDIRLPNRKELTILVPLTEQQVRLYKQLLCGLDAETVDAVMSATNSSSDQPESAVVTTSTSSDSDWRKLMNMLLQLRKICNHTYLMPDIAPEPYTVTGNHYIYVDN